MKIPAHVSLEVVKNFQEFLKYIKKHNIQKFINKSKQELLSIFIQCEQSKQENFAEGNQQLQQFQNQVTSPKTQEKQKIEESQKTRTETSQILKNFKQNLQFTQELDDDSLRSLIHDFLKQSKGNKDENHTSSLNHISLNDLQSNFISNKQKILFALSLMIQEKIPYPKILQGFVIHKKKHHYTIKLKDTDDQVNELHQKIKEQGGENKQLKQINDNKTQINLIYEMMLLVYNKREQLKEQIEAICSGIVFKKKLMILNDIVQQKNNFSDKVFKLIFQLLERIAGFLQGPIQQQGGNANVNCEIIQQKITKRVANSLLLIARQKEVPVPEVLQFLSHRQSKQNNQIDSENSLGISFAPNIDLLQVIIDKQGMKTVSEQLNMHGVELLDLDLKKLLLLDQLCFDQSVGFSNCEEKCETILYQTLDLVLQRIDELDQLSFVINDRKFKALQQKLNEVYKEDTYLEPNQELDLPLYVACVMNKIEFHAKKNLPEVKTQVNVRELQSIKKQNKTIDC